ncbi:hypothetical protein [Streptomyces sp. NPDC058989]|uniref:hypothetical protein n=1 Tax=Streptomyces sp. NPDC058989 TaxID=3346686 RepID=UPI0036AE7CAF
METGRARTGRSDLLLDQFDCAREMAQVRLAGLGDEEYLWEPAPDCWSIRRRGEAVTPRAFGPGDWVLDQGAPQIPSSEYAEVARQAAGGMTVAKIAEDWGVSVERVEQLDTIGFSQYPHGSHPDDPFVDVLWGANLEFIHHMAEIALLRDLWRTRAGTRG